jgi:hypothetical protein
MENQLTKRVICLWKGCDCVFEETGLFQEHLHKHGQEQMQQNLEGNKKDDGGTEKEEEKGNELVAKKAKLDAKERYAKKKGGDRAHLSFLTNFPNVFLGQYTG